MYEIQYIWPCVLFSLYLTTLEIVYIIHRITKLRKTEKMGKSHGSVKL